jgi:hypothetical protein
VVDEVEADAVVAAGQERHFQLRADAVGAGDEHGVAVALLVEAEEAAEQADVGQDGGREGGASQLLDASHRFVAGVDVNAGLAVVHGRKVSVVSSQ